MVKAKRIPEAAFFAKTYAPSKISKLVQLWREDLQKSHPVACKFYTDYINLIKFWKAQKIADPLEYDQFDDLAICQKIEEFIYSNRKNVSVPAHQFNEYNELLSQDFFALLKNDPSINLQTLSIIPEIQAVNPLIEKFQSIDINGEDNAKYESVADELE